MANASIPRGSFAVGLIASNPILDSSYGSQLHIEDTNKPRTYDTTVECKHCSWRKYLVDTTREDLRVRAEEALNRHLADAHPDDRPVTPDERVKAFLETI
jgi:hypothetical protein